MLTVPSATVAKGDSIKNGKGLVGETLVQEKSVDNSSTANLPTQNSHVPDNTTKNSPTRSFLRKESTLLLKSFVSLPALFGVGILAALMLPRTVSVAVAAIAILPPLYKTLIASNVPSLTPVDHKQLMQSIRRGRYTANIDGDFVVFLIGIRVNRIWELTGNFKKAGDMMRAMVAELDANPELGCLGNELYMGAEEGGSKMFQVQYWRSAEHLQQYAASQTNKHHSPWFWLMKLGKESDEFGFWHETFQVKAGQYEAIYVNCPPFHLTAARGVTVQPAAKSMKTMMGRLGRSSGDAEQDWPTEFATDVQNY